MRIAKKNGAWNYLSHLFSANCNFEDLATTIKAAKKMVEREGAGGLGYFRRSYS